MRHFKTLAVTALIGSATFAHSVMDLQFVKRWNISGPTVCDFKRIAKTPQGGFIAYGKVGVDLALVSYDSSGNILAAKRWDSPERSSEAVASIAVDTNGDVYMLACPLSQLFTPTLYLTKFTGATLTQVWEKKLVSSTGTYSDYFVTRSGTNASESIMVSTSLGSSGNTEVARYSKTGTLLGTTVITRGTDIETAIPAPDTAGYGVVLCGYSATKSWIAHVNGTGTVVFDQPFAFDNSRVRSAAFTTQGRVVATGGTSDTLHIYRREANNTWTVNTRPNFSQGMGIAWLTGSTFAVSASTASGEKMFTYDSVSGAFGAPVDNFGASGEVVPSNANYSVGGGSAFGVIAPFSTAYVADTQGLVHSVSTGFDILSVGTGGTLHSKGSGVLSSGLTISGYTPRDVADAIPDGSGGIYQVVYPTVAGSTYLQRLNSSGALLWSRAIDIPFAEDQEWRHISRYSNGDIAVAGSISNGLLLTRYTAAGAKVFAKRMATPTLEVFYLHEVAVNASNQVSFFGTAYTGSGSGAALVRTAADGTGLQTSLGPTGTYGYLRACPIPTGYAVLGGTGPMKVQTLDANGTATNTADVASTLGADMDADANGRIATAGLVGNNCEVKVRNPDFSLSLNTTITGVAPHRIRLGANGEVRVLYASGGSFRLRSYTGTGAMAWDVVVPPMYSLVDMDVDASNGWTYITTIERTAEGDNVNVVRFLANGVRSAQRRTAGRATMGLLNSGPSFWALGSVTTRGKSMEAFATKWSLP